MAIEIEVVREATDEVMAAFARLLPQLSPAARPLTRDALVRMLSFDAAAVLIARLDGRIVGTLTLLIFPVPSGIRARIEDLVVDEAARGQGVAWALTAQALEMARRAGVRTVDLTASPAEEDTTRVYERLGFQWRESSVYRFVLDR